MTTPNLPKLIEGAYAAALDDSLWSGWSEMMTAEFGAQGALFWVVDRNHGEIRRSHLLFPGSDIAKVLDEYYGGFIDLDFRLKTAVRSDASEIISDSKHGEIDRPQDREFLSWQLDRVKTCHYLAAMVALPNGLKAGVSVHRTPAAGHFTREEHGQMQAMFGHFAHAVRLGMQHNELLQTAWWEGLRSQNSDAAFLLDEQGRVLRFSEQAAQLMAEGLISVQAGNLMCKDPSARSKLATVIARAVQGDESSAGYAMLSRPGGLPGYRVAVSPLSRQRRHLAPFEAAAIVHVIDPLCSEPVDGQALRELYGLTEAEARLASALAAGHSLTNAAAQFGVAVGTVRAQLKSIFGKMGVNRQQDLILRVSSCR